MHRTIKGFDGIRALAVLAVVLTHLDVFGVLVKQGLLPPALIPLLHGATGVQAFFVMSGFLITTLLVKEYRASGTISIRHFILRRTLRIFPLYLLFLLIATLLHVFGRNVASWDSLFYAYIYSYNFIPRELYTSFMGHTWSLAVEEHFYLVWPTVFVLLFGRRRVALLGLLLSFILGAPVLHLLLVKAGLGEVYTVERWSFVAGASIALGCLAALLIHDERTAAASRRLAEHPLNLVLATLLYANSLYLHGDSWFLQYILAPYLRVIGMAMAIAWLYFHQASLAVRLLELRPLKYLGAISYGIYMYQGLFLDTGPTRDPNQSWPPAPEIGLLLLVVVAPLSYHYFEKPFLRLKGRYSAAKERPPLASQAAA